MKTALLIVERDFLVTHVGVRQVVLFYWRLLESAGYRVRLATPDSGCLITATPVSLAEVMIALNRGRSDAPDWRSTDKPDAWERAVRDGRPKDIVKWTDDKISTRDVSLSIVTNPWLCANGFPEERFTAGIVYDMVPNLLASGALRLGTVTDIYRFAHAHDVGYRIYQRQADKILSISESTRRDFLAFYPSGDMAARTEVVIPFDPPFSPRILAGPALPQQRRKLLLVNVLDPRKNFSGVERAVKLAMRETSFDIDVVGRERMPGAAAQAFLTNLADAGAHVRWYRSASAPCLQRLYAEADVLLFPSLYEGLGLPILEAQAHGTPVVSSNTSSCGEINLNPGLTFAPSDIEGLAVAMLEVFAGTSPAVAGPALAAAQTTYLKRRSALPSDWLGERSATG
ncbi:MAG TPA: glycosyltransferase [Brevundimonas sp.]|jgi:glycosyltransferase involved in cell wall biosynthesis